MTHVFCNDESLLSDGPIPNCTGPPPPNTVCQHKGFAFASTDSDAGCDFEGKDGLIESGKCTGAYMCFPKDDIYYGRLSVIPPTCKVRHFLLLSALLLLHHCSSACYLLIILHWRDVLLLHIGKLLQPNSGRLMSLWTPFAYFWCIFHKMQHKTTLIRFWDLIYSY